MSTNTDTKFCDSRG